MCKRCPCDLTPVLLCLLLMLPPLWAGSLLAAPLTFRQALELAAKNGTEASITVDACNRFGAHRGLVHRTPSGARGQGHLR